MYAPRSSTLALLMFTGLCVACGGGGTQLASETVAPPPPAQRPPAPTADDDAARRAEEEARRREAEARRAAIERARATLAEVIHFDYDQSAIRNDARTALDRKLDVLRQYPDFRVRIEGHCDERGSDEYNIALGNRRASAVLDYLTSRGIPRTRLEFVSLGEERPVDRGQSETAWARNRRAEFQILAGPSVATSQ